MRLNGTGQGHDAASLGARPPDEEKRRRERIESLKAKLDTLHAEGQRSQYYWSKRDDYTTYRAGRFPHTMAQGGKYLVVCAVGAAVVAAPATGGATLVHAGVLAIQANSMNVVLAKAQSSREKVAQCKAEIQRAENELIEGLSDRDGPARATGASWEGVTSKAVRRRRPSAKAPENCF